MGTPTPTGTVTFSDGAATLATVAVGAGRRRSADDSFGLAAASQRGVAQHHGRVQRRFELPGRHRARADIGHQQSVCQRGAGIHASTDRSTRNPEGRGDRGEPRSCRRPPERWTFINGSTPIPGCTGLALAIRSRLLCHHLHPARRVHHHRALQRRCPYGGQHGKHAVERRPGGRGNLCRVVSRGSGVRRSGDGDGASAGSQRRGSAHRNRQLLRRRGAGRDGAGGRERPRFAEPGRGRFGRWPAHLPGEL